MSMLSTTKYRNSCLILAILFALLLQNSTFAQTVLRVDGDGGQANGDGITWPTAYKYLADAIAFAKNNPGVYDLWVAQGVYEPGQSASSPGSSNDKTATFLLDFNNIRILGGFAPERQMHSIVILLIT